MTTPRKTVSSATRRVLRASILAATSIAGCLPSTRPLGAQATWTLERTAQVDSVIRQIMDTAAAEPAMCLGVDVIASTHTVLAWQVVAAERVGRQQTRDMVTFSCPAGTALAHGHFLVRGHVDGPSDFDRLALDRLKPEQRPPAAIIVVLDRLRQLHYVVYGVQCRSPQ